MEYFLYDQFGDELETLITENNTANSICGYTSIANAVKAAELFQSGLNAE